MMMQTKLERCLKDLQNYISSNKKNCIDKSIQASEESAIELAIFDSYYFKKI